VSGFTTPRWTIAAWVAVALVFALRLCAAFALPLTGDEAYYWEWSRRLAGGYVDHPPAVAWTIALFAPLGHSPGVVRLGFVLCGGVASLAVAACASEIAGDRLAGAIAALALSLAPLSSIAFGLATPDGPYLMFWALALWFAARAFKRERALDWLALGVAVGGVLLSRVLGVAFLFGVLAYALGPGFAARRRGIALMLVAMLCVCAPLLLWNAQHGWATFAFGLVHRHQQTREFSLPSVVLEQFAAYSPGIFAAVLVAALRPRNALLAWTALPQFLVVAFFALFERVEIYWIFGFFVSLCAMLGVAFVTLEPRLQRIWSVVAVAPAGLLLALLFAISFAPAQVYALVVRQTGAELRNGGPFEIMTYAKLAADARRLAHERDAVVVTDGYGFSSMLDFDAGLAPVVIGYDWQGRQSHAWYPDSERPHNVLLVDKEPLATRPDVARHLAQACARVEDGGVHAYGFGAAPPRAYYFTWCRDLVPDGLAILRWEHDPESLR
jgi:hypothetical protein